MACSVAILSVGTELLIGKIADTNAQWIARRVTSLSGSVKRILIIGDNLVDISKSVEDSVSLGPTLLIITGGLGPTFDDMTLQGLANAFNASLRLNPEAETMVREKYLKYEQETGRKIELTPERLKMATLPEGSRALRNPAGTAPGVLLQQGLTTIIALPGVPKEMMAIFEESVEPIVKKAVGNLSFYAESVNVFDIIESELAPWIEETMRQYPKVYIKSHPKAPEPRPLIELHFSTTSQTLEAAKEEVGNSVAKISGTILKHNGRIQEMSSQQLDH